MTLSQGQLPDSHPLGIEDNHTTGREFVGEAGKIRLDQARQLESSSACRSPDQDYRGKLGVALCEERSEIGIGGYQDAIVGESDIEDVRVGSGNKPQLGNVFGIMSVGAKQPRQLSREVLVDQEPHIG